MNRIFDIIADWLNVPQVCVALSRPPNRFELSACRQDAWPGLQVGEVLDALESDVLHNTFTAADGAITFSNIAESQYADDRFLENAGVNAFLGVPLRDEAGIPIGVLAVLSPATRRFTEKEKDLLHAMNAAVVRECHKNGLFDQKPEVDNLDKFEFYRALVEGAAEGISVMDLQQQRIIFRNKAGREALQQACGLIGAAVYTGQTEDYSPEFQENGQRSAELAKNYLERAAAGESLSFEWLYQHVKTGQLTPGEMKVIRFSETQPHLIRISCSDISMRKAAEQQLRESEENLRITLSSIGDGVIATDSNGCVVRINPVAEQLTGWRKEDALGNPLSDIFKVVPSNKHGPTENIFQRVLRENKAIEMANGEYLLVARDKAERLVFASAAPIRHKEAVSGVVLVFRDVTREQKIRQMITRAEKMNATGQLAAGIAHDFNNILATISGALDLEKTRNPSLFDGLLLKLSQRIESSISRGKDLTDRMLVLATDQSQQVEKIDVCEVIDRAISILQSSIDKRIQVTKDISIDNSAVLGEASALENAILNMGINSAQAMPQGGEIRISLHHPSESDLQAGNYPDHQDWLRLSVTDSGIGIPPENLNRIFEPFYTTKGANQGTGLGLAIVYATAEQHEGYVEATSEPGRGTTVSLYLPTAEIEESSPKLPTPEVGECETPRGRTVLFVDDEPLIRDTYATILEDLGCKVMLANDGDHAVRVFERNKDDIELILMDLSMPTMNGDQAAQEIRQLSNHCPIVICTGHITKELKEAASDLAIARILKKPYDVKSLKEVLTALDRS